MRSELIISIMLTFLLAAAGCTNENPDNINTEGVSFEQLNYGRDLCEFSNEVIETVRYGGRIEMNDSEVFNFMSVECLAGFYLKLSDKSQVKSLKVVDFKHGKRLLHVDEVVFLHSRLRPSPNGMFLTAVDASDEKMKKYIYDAYPGPYLEWDEVLELVRDEWDLTGFSASFLN